MKTRIKELREKAGLSQQALADKIGTSRQHIGAWETGARNPSIESAVKLSEAFQVSLDYLIKGEEKMTNKILGYMEEYGVEEVTLGIPLCYFDKDLRSDDMYDPDFKECTIYKDGSMDGADLEDVLEYMGDDLVEAVLLTLKGA